MTKRNFEKLEVGKTYKTRAGEVVKITEDDGHPVYPFETDAGYSYTSNGDLWDGSNSGHDLIKCLSLYSVDPVVTPTVTINVPTGTNVEINYV